MTRVISVVLRFLAMLTWWLIQGGAASTKEIDDQIIRLGEVLEGIQDNLTGYASRVLEPESGIA